MKKLFVFTLIGAMALSLVGCSGKKSDNEQLANPWVESDHDGVEAATGLVINAPEGATDVVYSYLDVDEKLAQVTYKYESYDWTYRIQPADELTDISGLVYEWDYEGEDTVAGREAIIYSYINDDVEEGTADPLRCVRLANWYDKITGITYSLSVSAQDLNGYDMKGAAEAIFEPMQGED